MLNLERLGRVREGGYSRKNFPFQELQASTTAGANVADFVFGLPLGCASSGVTTADNCDGSSLSGRDNTIHQTLCSFAEVFEFEYSRWTVPYDHLGALQRFCKNTMRLLNILVLRVNVG